MHIYHNNANLSHIMHSEIIDIYFLYFPIGATGAYMYYFLYFPIGATGATGLTQEPRLT